MQTIRVFQIAIPLSFKVKQNQYCYDNNLLMPSPQSRALHGTVCTLSIANTKLIHC